MPRYRAVLFDLGNTLAAYYQPELCRQPPR